MAIPPDPIEEVLPHASLVVVAEVLAVEAQQPGTTSGLPSTYTSRPETAGSQSVTLRVERALHGDARPGEAVKAYKPAGAYALREGNRGPFLLKSTPSGFEILGRYGPDTYSEKAIASRVR